MRFRPLRVEGAWLIEPDPHVDERGLFARTWSAEEFRERGLSTSFVQASVSWNPVMGTLRGMHYQVHPGAENKLVRCTSGSIFDVVLDLREQSPTFRKWSGATLTATNRAALYVPEGCAHGFLTLADESEVLYEITASYEPTLARGVRFDDPAFAIEWPSAPTRISERDAHYPLFIGDLAP
jgi:dTDP-4-dehydrorhamnose 3,5-epimerase